MKRRKTKKSRGKEVIFDEKNLETGKENVGKPARKIWKESGKKQEKKQERARSK